MDPPPWLPAALAEGPFTVSSARRAGVPGSRLRAPHLHQPTRSVRSASPPHTTAELVRAFGVALPDDCVFSHVTAAQLWRLPLPEGAAGTVVIDVMRDSRRGLIRRKGCRGHRGLELRRTAIAQGLPVTSLADTWVDLGEVAAPGLPLDELVLLGDDIATRLDGPAEPGEADGARRGRGQSELAGVLEARTRPRGKTRLTEALGLVRSPVRSPMETRARLMFVRAGFPEPEVNVPVFDNDGFWMLEGDLVWRDQRVVGEYQGRDHASIRRRSYDANRSAVAEDHGWRVLEIYADDVYRPPRRVACLGRFARALGLDVDRLMVR